MQLLQPRWARGKWNEYRQNLKTLRAYRRKPNPVIMIFLLPRSLKKHQTTAKKIHDDNEERKRTEKNMMVIVVFIIYKKPCL